MADIQYMKINMILIIFSGIWPKVEFNSQIKKVLYAIWGKFLISIVILLYVTFLIYFWVNLYDISLVIENINSLIYFSVLIVKISFGRYRTKIVEQIFDKMRFEENRAYAGQEVERKIYMACLVRNKRITKCYWFFCVFCIVYYYLIAPVQFMLTLIEERIPMPLNSWVPLDLNDKTQYYIAYVYLSVSCIICDISLASIDQFFVSLIIFGIGQFEIIQQRIKDLNPHQDDCYEEVAGIVKHHYRIIDYYENLENFIKPISLLVFLGTTVICSSVAIKLLLANGTADLQKELIYLLSILLQLFFYFWYGNEVIVESQNVGAAVAESRWYKFSPRVRKALVLLMIGTKRPISLSTGFIYQISLETYIMLVKVTYTFITIFQSIIIKN